MGVGPLQKGHRQRTVKPVIQRVTLEAECLRLRGRGYSLEEIGHIVGITVKNPADRVGQIIRSALERKVARGAAEVRQDLLDRLDRSYNMALRIATEGGSDRVSALATATQIAARMAALVGADAPKELDLKDDRSFKIDDAAAAKLVERLAEEDEQAEAERSQGTHP